MSHEQNIAAALRRLDKRLRKKANLVGYGVGRKRKGAKLFAGPSAIFYVAKKLPEQRLKRGDILPRTIRVGRRTVRTDVVQLSPIMPLGDPVPNQNKGRAKPVLMGFGIGICQTMVDKELFAGTLGAMVIDSVGSKMLLSAAHVMMAQGLDVITPSARYGGHNRDPKKFPPKVKGWPPPPKDIMSQVVRIAPPGIDAGYCESPWASTTIVQINAAPVAPTDPLVDLPVKKSGLRTGLTTGKIVAGGVNLINGAMDVWKNSDLGKLWSTGKFTKDGVTMPLPPPKGVKRPKPKLWKPKDGLPDLFFVVGNGDDFGDGGDSGSLIVTGPPGDDPQKRNIPENSAVGLLIGKVTVTTVGGGITIVTTYIVGQKIATTLTALQLTLAP